MKYEKPPCGSPQGGLQLVKKPLFGEKAFRFAGGVRGGGSPLVLNRMPAKSLRRQAFAPHRGCFLGCEADKKARHCSGRRKSPADFFDSLKAALWISTGRLICGNRRRGGGQRSLLTEREASGWAAIPGPSAGGRPRRGGRRGPPPGGTGRGRPERPAGRAA